MSRKNRKDYDLTLDEALQLMEGSEEVQLVAPPQRNQIRFTETTNNLTVVVTKHVGQISERVPAAS